MHYVKQTQYVQTHMTVKPKVVDRISCWASFKKLNFTIHMIKNLISNSNHENSERKVSLNFYDRD